MNYTPIFFLIMGIAVARRLFVRTGEGKLRREVSPGLDRVTYYLAGVGCVVAGLAFAFELPNAESIFSPVAIVLFLLHNLVANTIGDRSQRDSA